VKTPALLFRQTGTAEDRRLGQRTLDLLDRYHGQASGIFSGDECLAGKMPSQGTETCAVVEYMFSLELLLAAFGETEYGDRLEQVAFNALPAACSDDMWTRQYVQQANQPISKLATKPIYTTNGPDANLFGLETNFGCCTANMHQGWPKFTAHLWMKTDKGLAAVAYAPSQVDTKIAGQKVRVELATDYPFRDELNFTVTVDQPIRFPLALRIPGWAKQPVLTLPGEAPQKVNSGDFHTIDREWQGVTHFSLRLPMSVVVEPGFNGAVSIHRGPLVYSLKIGESWSRLKGTPPNVTYQVLPTTPWNYALLIDQEHPEKSIRFEEQPVGDSPFSGAKPAVKATVQGRLLPDWKLGRDAADPPPKSPVESTEPLVDLTLIPYGAAKLRITEFPTLAK
jgi:hypothetical protein